MRRIEILACLLVCFGLVSGCDILGLGDSEPTRRGGENYTLTKEANPVNVTEISVAEKTDSKIVFETSGSKLDIEKGDVIFSKIPEGTPENEIMTAPRFLRETEEVQVQGNRITVSTSQAALVEAVKEASLQFSASLNEASKKKGGGFGNWKVTSVAKGVSVNSCDDIQLANVTIPAGDNFQVSLENGNVSFCPDLDGKISITGASVDTFSAVGSGGLTYNTDVVASASTSLEKEGEVNLASFVTGGVAGFVPYTVTISLVAGFEATATGTMTMSTGIESGGTVELGARYINGNWTSISEQEVSFNSRQVEWGREAGAVVRGYIRPEITGVIISSAAADLYAGPYVELDAKKSEDLVKDYEYGVYGGLNGGVGFDIEILEFVEIAEYEKQVFDVRRRIVGVGPTNPPPKQPSSPQPSNGEQTNGTNPTLRWSVSDPDNDDLTYDVHFGTSSSPQQAATDLSSRSYDSGTLEQETTYYWKVVVTDHDGASTQGPVWSFTTPANPPPNQPSSPQPADGAETSGTNPTLRWEASDPDSDDLAYDVHFGPSSSPQRVASDLSSKSYDPGTLQNGTKYYWKIVVTDQDGASTEGPVWSFTTPSEGGGDNPNPTDTPWPTFAHDMQRTGRTSNPGPQSAEIAWTASAQHPNNRLDDPALGPDGTIYVGADDNEGNADDNQHLYAFNPNGTLKWTYNALKNHPSDENGEVDAAPTLRADGTIYISSDSDHLHALNSDGTRRWATRLTTQQGVNSSPAVTNDGTVYVGTNANELNALDAQGSVQWTGSLNGSVASAAIGSNGTVYASSSNGEVAAFRPNGERKWSYDVGGRAESAPTIGPNGTVYIGSGDGNVYALRSDGTKKWNFETGGAVSASPSIGSDGTIYVGSRDGSVYALRPDGTLKWKYQTGGAIHSAAAIGGEGGIYVGSRDNTLYALHSDGALAWTVEVDARIQTAPVIGENRRIYVTAGTKLYAIGP